MSKIKGLRAWLVAALAFCLVLTLAAGIFAAKDVRAEVQTLYSENFEDFEVTATAEEIYQNSGIAGANRTIVDGSEQGLSGNALKLLACIFMFVDHVGMILLPGVVVLRAIGRLAMPLFAFTFAEGCFYSRHRGRRFAFILGLGLVTSAAMSFVEGVVQGNILITLTLASLVIYALDALKRSAFAHDTKIVQMNGSAARRGPEIHRKPAGVFSSAQHRQPGEGPACRHPPPRCKIKRQPPATAYPDYGIPYPFYGLSPGAQRQHPPSRCRDGGCCPIRMPEGGVNSDR